MGYFEENIEQIHREVKNILKCRLDIRDDVTSTEIVSIIGNHLNKQEDYILDRIRERLSK